MKNTPVVVPEIVKHTVEQMLNKLQIMGCSYQVMLSDGTLHTHKLEAFDTRKRRDTDKPYAFGDIKKHYDPYIQNLKPGDVVSVPCTDVLTLANIQGSLTAHLSHVWGAGNYTTYSNKDAKTLEVMRLG